MSKSKKDDRTRWALGDIASLLGVPVHRVSHVVRTRGIAERERVGGHFRLWDAAGVSRIKGELTKIGAKK